MKKFFLLAMTALMMLACNDYMPGKNGALTGVFSVSSKDEVCFAKGNLQYNAGSNTWRFADQQYDIIGAENANISPSYKGWIDLFGWGTGANPTLATTNEKDYAEYVEWGANKIVNGGNKKGKWRTLTYDEWRYIVFRRPSATALRSFATVANVQGCVLLPDDWKTPSGLEWSANQSSYAANVYSVSEWSKMEAAGALFLPAAGHRVATEVFAIGETGMYYSSSADDDEAVGFYFSEVSGDEWVMYTYPRRFAQSVRLVRDL